MYMYLAGAMRGFPDNNFPEFYEYAAKLRNAGFQVISPAESPPPNVPAPPGRADCLRHDLLVIGIVDAVAVLPNWNDSPGARLEVAAAWAFDIPVYEADMLISAQGGWFPSMPPVTNRERLRALELDKASVVIPREKQYYEKRPLVGLSGFAQAGKDAVANVLTQHHGYARVAFADPLKELALALGWNGEKDDLGRKFLQDLGLGVRDHLDAEAWVLAAEERIEMIEGPVVVTDVRFPNEVQMLHRRGGKLIRIERPGIGAVNAHVSEHLVNAEHCDGVLQNDGTLAELRGKVEQFFGLKSSLNQAELIPV